MPQTKALFDLQGLDSEIDRRKKRLAEIASQLRETSELREARVALKTAEDKLHDLQTQQKAMEWDAEKVKERIADLERRMMSGERNSRDLQAIEKELVNQRERQKSLEDSAIGLMEQVEQMRKSRDEQAAVVQTLEGQWQVSQADLLSERKRLEGELPEWEKERKDFVADVDAASLRVYDVTRACKAGLAVVRAERGICTGCRITLPSTLVQRARAGREIVYCSSCGRILHAA